MDSAEIQAALEAVKRDGLALEHIQEQTPQICLAAVEQNGAALEYIRDAPIKVLIAAITNTPYAAAADIDYATLRDVRMELYGNMVPEVTATPNTLNVSELEDPLTLEPPVSGDIYGFVVLGDKWHLGISLIVARKFLVEGFRGSNLGHLFMPILNTLYPMENIKWVRL